MCDRSSDGLVQQHQCCLRWSCVTTPMLFKTDSCSIIGIIVQELCESRGGRPGLSVLMSLLASMDVKIY